MGITIRVNFPLYEGYRKRFKEFTCHGDKNTDEICEDCTLKFRCFTEKKMIEIDSTDMVVKNWNLVDAATIAEHLNPKLKVFLRQSKSGKIKTQVDFNNVRKFK